MNHSIRRLAVAALVALSTAALAATAIAASGAKPEKGKTYSGVIRKSSTDKIPISFKVSKSGKSVGHFTFSYPTYCSNAGGFPAMKSRSATISSKGAFTAKLPLTSLLTHKGDGHVTVTGKFEKAGREKGEVITDLKKGGSCNGKSPYSTKAQ